jgi:hypothetical protein
MGTTPRAFCGRCPHCSSLLTAEEHREVLSTALAAQISGREDRFARLLEVE